MRLLKYKNGVTIHKLGATIDDKLKFEGQAPVVRKPISANPRLNHPNPRSNFILLLNSVPRSSISTIQGLN